MGVPKTHHVGQSARASSFSFEASAFKEEHGVHWGCEACPLTLGVQLPPLKQSLGSHFTTIVSGLSSSELGPRGPFFSCGLNPRVFLGAPPKVAIVFHQPPVNCNVSRGNSVHPVPTGHGFRDENPARVYPRNVGSCPCRHGACPCARDAASTLGLARGRGVYEAIGVLG